MEPERSMSLRSVRGGRKTNILRVNMWCVSLHSLSSRRVTAAIPFPWHWNVYRVRLKRRESIARTEKLSSICSTYKRVIRKNLLWLAFVKEEWSMVAYRHICRFSIAHLSDGYLQLNESLRTVSRKIDISTRKTTFICRSDQFLELPSPIYTATGK